MAMAPSQLNAGTWMDNILNRRPPAYPVGAPVPVGSGVQNQVANYPTLPTTASPYAAAPYAGQYGAGQYGGPLAIPTGPSATPPSATGLGAIPFGTPQSVVGALPTASYDTTWNRTPVTYYRPVTTFDPRTGTNVTSLQPCTANQYQAQRIPMTAPRALLGEYGAQANRWPSITGPGYNPTGLSNTAMMPANGFQQLPNNGMVPAGNAGQSMGIPVSSLPTTTIPYNPQAYVPNVAPSYVATRLLPTQRLLILHPHIRLQPIPQDPIRLWEPRGLPIQLVSFQATLQSHLLG
jgi:hypothetical protein